MTTFNDPRDIGCRCMECGEIHRDFIENIGRWPNMTHKEGQALKKNRIDNERSWQRALDR